MKAEEFNVPKKELETMNKQAAEITEDELKQVTGGGISPLTCDPFPKMEWKKYECTYCGEIFEVPMHERAWDGDLCQYCQKGHWSRVFD